MARGICGVARLGFCGVTRLGFLRCGPVGVLRYCVIAWPGWPSVFLRRFTVDRPGWGLRRRCFFAVARQVFAAMVFAVAQAEFRIK